MTKFDGLCVFATVKSGNCITLTMSVELLLLVLDSVHVHCTVAVLLKLEAAFAATFTVSEIGGYEELLASESDLVQVTAGPLFEQFHPVPDMVFTVRPVGSVS